MSKPHRSPPIEPHYLGGSSLGLSIVGRGGVLPPTIPPTIRRQTTEEERIKRTGTGTASATSRNNNLTGPSKHSTSLVATSASTTKQSSTKPGNPKKVTPTTTPKLSARNRPTNQTAASTPFSSKSSNHAPSTQTQTNVASTSSASSSSTGMSKSKPTNPLSSDPVASTTLASSVSASYSSSTPYHSISSVSSNSPFPEYSADFLRQHGSLIHTVDALSAPYMPPSSTPKPPVDQPTTKPLRQFPLDAHGRIHIPLTDLVDAVEFVHSLGRTSLILDSTDKVDSFYTYNPTQLIEAKKLFLTKMHGRSTLEDQLEFLRKRLLTSMRYGHTLLISLTDSAVDFLTQYNSPNSFPIRTVCSPTLLTQPAHHSPFIRTEDREDVKGLWFGMKAPHDEFRVVLTSQFELEDYEEFLKESIPLDLCTVIVIQHPKGTLPASPLKQLKFLQL